MEVSSAASADLQHLDEEIVAVGTALSEAIAHAHRRPSRAVDDRAMKLTTRDPDLRAAIFRLVDVTPACRNLDDLGRHLAGMLDSVGEPPTSVAAAMRVADTKAGRVALGAAVATSVRHMAHRFIAGSTPEGALRELGRLWSRGIGSSVDLLGEATVSAAEADEYAARCLGALEDLSAGTRGWRARPVLERDSAGALPRVNLSVKVTALTPVLHPESPERGREDAAKRMRPLLRRARDLGAHIHVDMESLDSHETTLGLVSDLLGEPEFADGPSAGVVVQAYLRDSPGHVERILSWAERAQRHPPLVIRLVKGAYWDHEAAEAEQHGWSVPVFEDKAECDRNYEALTRMILDARPRVRVAIASHNLRSLAHAIAYSRLRGGADADLELQVLRGLGDEVAQAVSEQGLRARVYSPVGDLVSGMAYLVRRLLENASNDSFLFAQAEGTPLAELLAAP